jgi:MFS transporter, PPP family, 3-phenylpropionic acid transporter
MTARHFSFRFSLSYALMMIGAGVQLPFLPLWLSTKGLSVSEIAAIVAGMMAVRVVGAPLFAWAADHFGNRRQIIRLCSFFAFVAYSGMALMEGFGPIAAMALLAAFFFSPVFPLSEGFSVEASTALGLDYGRMRLWASLSFLTGSLGAGALLTLIDADKAAWLLASAQALSVVSAILLPDEPEYPPSTDDDEEDVPYASAGRFLFFSGFLLFVIAAGLGQASHAMMNGFSSVQWESMGFDTFSIGVFWSFAVLSEVLLLAFSRRVVMRFGPALIFLVGLGGGIVRWTGMAFADQFWIIVLLQILHVASFALTHLGTMHMIRRMVPDHLRNRAQGIYSAVSGGVLFSSMIWMSGTLYAQFAGYAYLFMAGVSTVALAGALLLFRSNPTMRQLGEA